MRKGMLHCTTLPFPTVRPNAGRWKKTEIPGTITNSDAQNQVWSDGKNVYRSEGWATKNVFTDNGWVKADTPWNISLSGGINIWTDGVDIYYSYTGYEFSKNTQYVLRDGVWEPKEWNIEYLSGEDIWTDGTNIYYTHIDRKDGREYSYVLEDGLWKPKTWGGIDALNDFNGIDMWSDGANIYNMGSISRVGRVLKDGTWESCSIASTPYWCSVWSDGVDIYCKNRTYWETVVLRGDKWELMDWNVNPGSVWTDGVDIYMYANSDGALYILDRTQPQTLDPSSMLMGWLVGRAVASKRLKP